MVEKINTLCDQIYEDIQNLRESGNYDVEKRLGVEIIKNYRHTIHRKQPDTAEK